MRLAFLVWLAATFPWVPQLQVRQAGAGRLFRRTYYSCTARGALTARRAPGGEIVVSCESAGPR